MRGIDHAEDAFRTRCVLTQIEQDVTGDSLVGGMRPEAVAARKIKELDLFAMLTDELARLFLHGNPGIVGDLLPKAGQRIEERGLSTIRIADHGVRLRSGPGSRHLLCRFLMLGNGDACL
jgi:hypothetical protein